MNTLRFPLHLPSDGRCCSALRRTVAFLQPEMCHRGIEGNVRVRGKIRTTVVQCAARKQQANQLTQQEIKYATSFAFGKGLRTERVTLII